MTTLTSSKLSTRVIGGDLGALGERVQRQVREVLAELPVGGEHHLTGLGETIQVVRRSAERYSLVDGLQFVGTDDLGWIVEGVADIVVDAVAARRIAAGRQHGPTTTRSPS